jgi:hypothetical protein
VEIAVPRDRDSSFEPKIVAKRQRRLPGVEDMVISLSAKGLTHGEISAHSRGGIWRGDLEAGDHYCYRATAVDGNGARMVSTHLARLFSRDQADHRPLGAAG